MALPVVMKSGKNYILLVLDGEMDFATLLQHIVTKFMEAEKFFGAAPFAVMIEGRELSDTEKCQMLDAVAEYTSVHISVLIENDKLKEEFAEKTISQNPAQPYHEDETGFWDENPEETDLKDNCLMICRNLDTGEKISVEGSIVIKGDVASGAIIKAGGNIVVLGKLKGQAIAGTNPEYQNPCIIAWDFKPQNYRIGSVLGEVPGKSIFGLNKHRRGGAKIAQFMDGEIQINKLNIKD